MRSASLSVLASSLLMVVALPAWAMPHPHRGPTSPRLFKSRSAPRPAPRASSSARIAPERATQIQTALIKSGYMTGEPTGMWDSQTQAAMQKLQADNGWQTKLVPDSRAIIRLGLGPNASAGTENEAAEAAGPASEPAPPVPANR